MIGGVVGGVTTGCVVIGGTTTGGFDGGVGVNGAGPPTKVVPGADGSDGVRDCGNATDVAMAAPGVAASSTVGFSRSKPVGLGGAKARPRRFESVSSSLGDPSRKAP